MYSNGWFHFIDWSWLLFLPIQRHYHPNDIRPKVTSWIFSNSDHGHDNDALPVLPPLDCHIGFCELLVPNDRHIGGRIQGCTLGGYRKSWTASLDLGWKSD
jgi:hypothetical protein